MSRRSSRLVSGGYYNSDEESDSSSVTNISYRENPVKVFKKKGGTRKAGPRTPNRANTDATSLEPPAASAGPSPSPLSLQPTMKTVSFPSTVVTPRPPLTSSVPLKKSDVDSSGYSSSEGPRGKLPAPSGTSRTSRTRSVAPSTGYWDRMSRAFFRLKDLINMHIEAACDCFLTAAPGSLSSSTKKALLLLLLLLLLLAPMCVWLRPRLLTAATETTPPPVDPAVVSAAVEARLLHLLDSSMVSAAVEAKLQRLLDPKVSDAVEAKMQRLLVPTGSAAVEAKMQRLWEEQQVKQELFLSQMQERLQLDVRDTRARLEADRQHLEREVSSLAERMADQRTDCRSAAAAAAALRLRAVEAQNAKLSQAWRSVQRTPPPAPCPDAGNPHDPLTPELQQAVEKWLSDRIKQDAGGGSRSDCGRPMADKMADFALETQGGSVISTRCSQTYRIRSACLTLLGFPLWYPSESPRTVIQGHPGLLPGKCWAFHGAQGTLVVSLSHPVSLTHVTLDHLPRYSSPTGRIDSAPKDFEVYGLKDEVDQGTLLGTFTYDQDGGATQTFQLPGPGGVLHRCVELRVLSNWGHVEYTCLYRFRVHGRIAAT
ncbi:uncharacterized protein ACO6RY_20143 [Pungitius sinensis]